MDPDISGISMQKERKKAFRDDISVMEILKNTICLQVSITVNA